MKKLACLALVCLLAAAAVARAQEDPGKVLHRGVLAMKEGRFEEALGAFRKALDMAGDDEDLAPVAMLRAADCLARMGRLEEAVDMCRKTVHRFPDRPEIVKKAKWMAEELGRRAEARRRGEEENQVLAKKLEALERQLKEKGLRGQELERAFREGKEKIVAALEKERRSRDVARAVKLMKERGVPPEEIEARIREMKERSERLRELREESARLREEAGERGRENEETERRLHEIEEEMRGLERGEAEWAHARRKDMEGARREFLHLAQKLGIPGDEAERFLDEQMRRRHRIPERQAWPRPREGGLEGVIRGLQEENERLRAHLDKLTDFARQLEERVRRLEKAFRPDDQRRPPRDDRPRDDRRHDRDR